MSHEETSVAPPETRIEVSAVPNVNCILGEGLHWDSRRQTLWLVDVIGQKLISINLENDRIKAREVPEPIGWAISIVNSDSILVGLKSGLALIDVFDDQAPLKWLDKSFPGVANVRLNDAKIDAFGDLWCGY